MKKALIAGLVIATSMSAASVANAENAGKKEFIGVGAGATIGGVVGGPPGVILGAAIGGLFGDRADKKDERLEALAMDVERRARHNETLSEQLRREQSSNDALAARIDALDKSGVIDLHQMLHGGIELDLPFRTDDVIVGERWQERLGEIAGAVAGSPELAVRIDGYADPRGSSDYNRQLSLARAEAVRNVLLDAGLPLDRISTFGHGEPVVVDQDSAPDSDLFAMQRRVTVTIYRDDTGTGVAHARH